MDIVVCIKAVPSTTEVRMDPVTNTIVRDGKQSVVNPFDASALEVAVQIKELLGGHIAALSMGIPDTVRLLRDCLARGADEGVLLSDRAFAGADTLATSYALSCAIRQMADAGRAPDLILCGKMAVDGDTAQIGPELAATLGMSCVTDACEVLAVEPGSGDQAGFIRVRRVVDGGHAVVEAPLPAVITVVKDICIPRMPSIGGVRFGVEGPVAVKTAADVEADRGRIGLSGSPTQVVRSFTPERASAGIAIEGDARQQAEQLAALVEGMGL